MHRSESMKKGLTNGIVITVPLPLIVETDVSDIASAAILSQSGTSVVFSLKR